MRLSVDTAPTEEPVRLADLKTHCRIDTTDDDDWLIGARVLAREAVENDTGRALCTQTWDITYDDFPASSDTAIVLPLTPLSSVTSITYTDTNGDAQTWSADDYQVDNSSDSWPARIKPSYGETYPTVYDEMSAVTVKIVCGYGEAAVVPQWAKFAIQLAVGTLYEHREEVEAMPAGMRVEMIRSNFAYNNLIGRNKIRHF